MQYILADLPNGLGPSLSPLPRFVVLNLRTSLSVCRLCFGLMWIAVALVFYRAQSKLLFLFTLISTAVFAPPDQQFSCSFNPKSEFLLRISVQKIQEFIVFKILLCRKSSQREAATKIKRKLPSASSQ